MNRRQQKTSTRSTLSDIARHAGVSVSTASLVLSGKGEERRISSDAMRRVRTAAAELDYSPNLLVHSLQRGRTNVLSFFNGFRERTEDDLYMDRFSAAIEMASGSRGYDVLLSCDFRRPAEATYRYLNGGLSDGLLLFAPRPDDPLLPFLRTSLLPAVLINAVDTEGMLSHVRDDQAMGMRLVAEDLVARGHTRVAALTNVPVRNPEADQRVTQLRQFMADLGHPISDRWVLPTFSQVFEKSYQPREALQFLLDEPEPPTALFCWHDRLGYQVLEQCEALGIAVPEQLSVIGYDGLRWPARTSHTLASVHVDLCALAAAGVTILDSLIQGKEQAPLTKTIPVFLAPGTTLARLTKGS